MIYVVVSDGFNRHGELINKNGDCRVLRQPQSLLPKEVKEYVEKTSNKGVRDERNLAYTTLFAALKLFFDAENCILSRTENGKPYICSSLPCPIFVNLSHSNGMVAVALSDEGEIGIDIQGEVEKKKADRLEARFLSDILPKSDKIDVKYFYMTLCGDNAEFANFEPMCDKNCDFLSKWAYTESLIKCMGLTFSDISKINSFLNKIKTQTVSIKNFKIATTIAK